MDRISNAVFDKILSLTPVGRYVIVAEDEFEDTFSEGGGNLKEAIADLKSGGYIDVKYSRGDMYCVAPLKENIVETFDEAETGEVYEERKFKLNYNFVSAFAGGALGSLIVSLIFALV